MANGKLYMAYIRILWVWDRLEYEIYNWVFSCLIIDKWAKLFTVSLGLENCVKASKTPVSKVDK